MIVRTALLTFFFTVAALSSAYAAGDTAAGKALFNSKCATCHGTSGEGKDSIAKLMKVPLRHLGSKEVQARSDAELARIVLEGSGKMKAISGMNAKSADDVVAYVRTLAKK